MARLLKCKWCLEKDEKEKMVKDGNGYYHVDNCHDLYLKDKEFKKRELEHKTKLAETIADVYELSSIQEIPRQIWSYIEDIRNDSQLFGKLRKNYKNGIPYAGIALTFMYCKDIIREAHRKKEFKNFMAELKYGIAIIKSNIVNAKNEYMKTVKQKENTQNIIKEIEKTNEVKEKIKQVQYNPKTKEEKDREEDKIDLTSLFD